MLAMIAGAVFLLVATTRPASYPGSIWVWPVFWAYLAKGAVPADTR
jgi:hypothetical protein